MNEIPLAESVAKRINGHGHLARGFDLIGNAEMSANHQAQVDLLINVLCAQAGAADGTLWDLIQREGRWYLVARKDPPKEG